MNIHISNKNEVAWTSWLPALGFALARSGGPVLEIGIGHFSTPFLHEYCKGAERMLISVEDNAEWAAQFKRLNHKDRFVHEGRWDDGVIPNIHWGCVFIDNSPGGEARLRPFLAFLGNSDYIVVHDYHRENEEAIKPFLGGINHRIFSDYEPPTLLASKRLAVE